jgi:hypothetical protein
VGAICNLVAEFNGLVSTKGLVSTGPLVFKRGKEEEGKRQ